MDRNLNQVRSHVNDQINTPTRQVTDESVRTPGSVFHVASTDGTSCRSEVWAVQGAKDESVSLQPRPRFDLVTIPGNDLPLRLARTVIHLTVPRWMRPTFFETFTLAGKPMYVLAVIEHATRRVRILSATAHPTAAWVTQSVRRLAMNLNSRARFPIRDRDAKYAAMFDTLLADPGMVATRRWGYHRSRDCGDIPTRCTVGISP